MKTLNKSKIVGIAAVSLAAVSLIGVGFASWVITGIKATTGSPEVSVTVGKVEDKRATITATVVNGSLCFDAPTTDKTGPIIYEEGTAGEDLEFSFTVSADQVVGGTIDVKAAIEGYTTSDGIGKAINDGYLTAPKLKNSSSSDVLLGASAVKIGTLTSSSTSATYEFEFGWGTTKFGGINPSLHANDSNVKDVLKDLNAFKDITIGNITITVTAEFVAA